MERLAQVYIREAVKLHGEPESIVSDWLDFNLDFGEAYPKLWALSCTSVQRYIPKQMDSQRELLKYLKIC